MGVENLTAPAALGKSLWLSLKCGDFHKGMSYLEQIENIPDENSIDRVRNLLAPPLKTGQGGMRALVMHHTAAKLSDSPLYAPPAMSSLMPAAAMFGGNEGKRDRKHGKAPAQ
jgi:hypothetical protein